MPIVSAAELTDLAQRILGAHGAPEDIAALVAESLVNSNLVGHDSHGVNQLFKYTGKIRDGSLVPDARPSVSRRFGSVATVDGASGFGQPAARLAVEQAAEIAIAQGISAVALANVNHVGRLGEYVDRLAQAGVIGMVMASGAGPGGAVAPFGGNERVFGTNPLAIGIPAGPGEPPIVVDFATSGIAAGKIDVANATGKPLPAGVLVDELGAPTTDPTAFDRGGALLPFGDHKGYGLMLAIELIANGLTGFAPAISTEYRPGNPTMMIALSIDAFENPDRFARLASELTQRIATSRPAQGFTEVLIPGEPERRALDRNRRDGIAIPDGTWQRLTALAEPAAAR